jgi:hypothetical protein
VGPLLVGPPAAGPLVADEGPGAGALAPPTGGSAIDGAPALGAGESDSESTLPTKATTVRKRMTKATTRAMFDCVRIRM